MDLKKFCSYLMNDMKCELRRLDKADFVQFTHLFYLEQGCETPSEFSYEDLHLVKKFIRQIVPINREGELFEYNFTTEERYESLTNTQLQQLAILEEEYFFFTNSHIAQIHGSTRISNRLHRRKKRIPVGVVVLLGQEEVADKKNHT